MIAGTVLYMLAGGAAGVLLSIGERAIRRKR